MSVCICFFFFFQAEDGIRDFHVTGVQTCALPISGGAPGAEDIRALLVTGEVDRWDAIGETLLFNAARRNHLRLTIWPALDAGKWVISDRFADSTMAYQGYGNGLGTRSEEHTSELQS